MKKLSLLIALFLATPAMAATYNGDDDSSAPSSTTAPTTITRGTSGGGLTTTDIGKTMAGQSFSCSMPSGSRSFSKSCVFMGNNVTDTFVIYGHGVAYSQFDANGAVWTRATGVTERINGAGYVVSCDSGWVSGGNAICNTVNKGMTGPCGTTTIYFTAGAHDDVVGSLDGNSGSGGSCTANHPKQYLPAYALQ